jgi:hypothetical protein
MKNGHLAVEYPQSIVQVGLAVRASVTALLHKLV